MATWQQILLWAYAVVVVLALFRHLLLTAVQKKMRFLAPASDLWRVSDAPLVSIIVPAKDEAHGIERCLRSILAQDYPRLEIVVVDDRSTDATPDIVRRLAGEDRRLRLIEVHDLPVGWTGKNHALDIAQQQVHGEWLLFIDADTRLVPSCVGVVLRDAIEHGVSLESMLLRLETESFWEKVVQPFAGACLMVMYPLGKVNQSKNQDLAFANGQFLMIHRKAYDLVGGHRAVRDKFVEDIHLARRIRAAGLELRVVMGTRIASVRMYSSLGDIVRGWSRILYSAVNFRPAKLYLLLLATLIFSGLSYLAVVAGGIGALADGSRFWITVFVLGIIHQLLQMSIMARIYRMSGSPLSYLALRFLAVGVMLYVFVRTIRMCATHRVTWRGTQYDQAIQQPV